jgi:hypothetical protein
MEKRQMIRSAILTVFPLIVSVASGCGSQNSHVSTRESVYEIASPAPQGTISPRVTAMHDGSVLLTWLEPAGDKLARLRAAFWQDGAWSAPVTVVEAQPFSRHPSESPGIIALSKANLIAYWSQKPPGEVTPTKEVDVYFSISTDRGLRWSSPTLASTSGTGEESSYPSAARTDATHAALIWLDGGNWTKQKRVSLMSRSVGLDASTTAPTVIDPDTCTCCPTSLVHTDSGLVAAYRGHTPENVRDISLLQNVQGRWSEPHVPHADHWHFAGCPVNGPHLDVNGATVALIWFSASDEPKVQLAFSHDEGGHFATPIRIDEGNVVGRAQVVLETAQSALGFWLEHSSGTTRLVGRRVRDDKTLGVPFEVARGSGLGYPHAIRSGTNALVTWTEESPTSQIHVAVAGESQKMH